MKFRSDIVPWKHTNQNEQRQSLLTKKKSQNQPENPNQNQEQSGVGDKWRETRKLFNCFNIL